MASLAKQPGDDDEQQQPALGGGATSPMMQSTSGGAPKAPTMGGGSNAAPQKSAMQGTGSNFVNLSSFLTPTVAKQNTEKVQTMGAKLGATEKQTFDKAADPLRTASFNAVQGDTRQLVDSLVPKSAPNDPNAGIPPGGYKDPNTGQIWGAKDPKTGARTEVKPQAPAQPAAPAAPNPAATDSLGQLTSMLTQDYAGPMAVDYDANNKNAQQWSQLGNADTTLNALAPENFTNNLPNSQGIQWLDEALIKGDRDTMGAVGASKAASEAFGTKAGEEAKALGEKATGLKAAAAAEREKRKGELTAYGDEMLGGIDARVTAKNQQEASDFDRGVIRDPATGEIIETPEGQKKAGWQAGSGGVGQGATKGNTATAEERGKLSGIAGLLGMDGYNVADEGQYQSGRYATERGDGYHDTGQLSVNAVTDNPKRTNNTDDARFTKNLTPEQKDEYRRIRSQYPALTSAQAAEDAKNGTDENRRMFGSGQTTGSVGQLQVKGVK